MPQILLSNVTLAFTNNMLRESEYGGWDYTFIINKELFCNKVREALITQKTQLWDANRNTDDFILSKCNAKSKQDVAFEPVKNMMSDTDILIKVKSKTCAIGNTKNVQLGRGTTADIIVDVFEHVYGKKEFICVRSHADRGCTVKINQLQEYKGNMNYFEIEEEKDASAVDQNAVEAIFGL